MRKILVALMLMLSPVTAAQAADKLPELGGEISAESPYGQGKLSFLWMDVYDAELWTDAAQWSMEAPFALSLIYHTALDAEDIISRTLDEMDAITSLDVETRSAYLKDLRRVIPDMQANDRFTGLYTPKAGVEFFHNGRSSGRITQPAFAESFFAIWLSPKTSEPALRAALLKVAKP
ncbi:MAG: chalcone isomerase family protein [Rickettsiales bacterium]|nr:chalcone isomerase family protein [Rickettsiales bacterium]